MPPRSFVCHLAHCRHSLFGPSRRQRLTSLLAEAQAWLLDQQNANGGFAEQRSDGSKGSSSVLATAWAYKALGAQAAPPAAPISNARNWMLAQQDAATGSWRSDALVTATVVAVLPAAAAAQWVDTDRDGITDVVEQRLTGNSSAAADARNPLTPPSLAVPGITMTSFTAPATVGQPFSASLSGASGYTLTAGSLPPGVSLNASTGLLSGTPGQAGNFKKPIHEPIQTPCRELCPTRPAELSRRTPCT